MKLVICIILQSWAVTFSTSTCIHPNDVTVAIKSVEVYQVTFQDTLNEATVKVNNTSGNSMKSFEACSNIKHLYTDGKDFNYTYHVLTLRSNPSVRFLLAESAVSMFSLQLSEEEETFCGKRVWRTDQSELVVAIGEENFINTTYDFMDPFLDKPVISSGTYNTRKKEDSAMLIKCKLYSYEEEIIQLRETISNVHNDLLLKDSEFDTLKDEVFSMKILLQDMQNEIIRYKDENVLLKKSLGRIKNTLSAANSNSALSKAKEDLVEVENLEGVGVRFSTSRKQDMLALPQFVGDVLTNADTCQCSILFPYDNLFCVLAAIVYVFFCVTNTVMNYFSLRLLRNKRQKCFVFFTLTQGLTSWYICRNQSLTRNKIDKWLLDIE